MTHALPLTSVLMLLLILMGWLLPQDVVGPSTQPKRSRSQRRAESGLGRTRRDARRSSRCDSSGAARRITHCPCRRGAGAGISGSPAGRD